MRSCTNQAVLATAVTSHILLLFSPCNLHVRPTSDHYMLLQQARSTHTLLAHTSRLAKTHSVPCHALQEIEDEAGVLEKGLEKEAGVLEKDLEQGLTSFGKGFTVLEQKLEQELTAEEEAVRKEIREEIRAAEKLLAKVGGVAFRGGLVVRRGSVAW